MIRSRSAALCAVLGLVVAACQGSATGGATQTAQYLTVRQTELAIQGTESALAAAETQLAAPATTTPTKPPAPTATRPPTRTPGPFVIFDDLSEDVGRWRPCGVCDYRSGELVMGPYPPSGGLSGYVALCEDCGLLQDYTITVDSRFLDGYTDRGWGIVLRYDEATGDYVDLEITTWQVYGVWTFDAEAGTWESPSLGWRYAPALYPSYGSNRVEVAVVGETAEIRINDVTVLLMEDMPPGPAQVGLTVGLHSMEVGFDQFLLEVPEGSLPAGSEA
jgi:hypothetical protein